MAAEAAKVIFLLFSTFLSKLLSYSQASLLPTCTHQVGDKKFTIIRRVWEYRSDGHTYMIDLCDQLLKPTDCRGAAICKLRGSADNGFNLGLFSKTTKELFGDNAGYSIEFTNKDGKCEDKSQGGVTSRILMRCGKYMGYPELIDHYTTDKDCVYIFEFITNQACNTPPTAAEVPCSFYSPLDGKKRDLTPLIKTKGGHQVASDNPSLDFHINICREITPTTGHTQHCPAGSAACNGTASTGDITLASMPKATSKYEIEIWYNVSKTVPGCPGKPFTKITLACPKELHQAGVRGPIMTSSVNCLYEVFWETQFACPQETLMSNNSCVLTNDLVQFDLTPLKQDGVNYKVYHLGADKKNYTYFINVCGSTNIPCEPDGTNASVCQIIPDSRQVVSLGVYYKQELRYADGELTLTYKSGKTCHSGFKRETVITFKCNPSIDKGRPVFSNELYCLYLFEWETKYACAPSRRTGSGCRVENDNGVRFDLSELVRVDQPNWLAIDGESGSSGKQFYINVCGKLSKDNRTSGCKPGSSACMILKDGAHNLGTYSDPPVLNPDNSVKLVYKEGDECVNGIKRTTTITFVCHPGDLTSPPVLVGHSQDNCQFTFIWKTAVACPLGVNVGENCKVQDPEAGYVFDLSPLSTAKPPFSKNSYFTANSTGSGYEFFLKVCSAFNISNTKCINAGACQQSKQSTYLIGRPNSRLHYYDGIIRLTYQDGDVCRHNKQYLMLLYCMTQPRKSHISFMCDPLALSNGIGSPVYDSEDECTYHFRWFTKYACPAKVIECAAHAGSDQYDLSSLVKTDDNWVASVKPTLLSPGKFYINICRSLNLRPEVGNCLGTSSVCLITNKGSAINLGSVNEALKVEAQDSVSLTYSGGDACGLGGKYSAEILFICKKGATGFQELGCNGKYFQKLNFGFRKGFQELFLSNKKGVMDTSPVFQGTDKCKYMFRWESAASCRITNVIGANCSVQDPKSSTVFNLLPLSKPTLSPYTLTTLDGRTFKLNICGKIRSCNADSSAEVGACLTEVGKSTIIGIQSQKLEFRGETLVLTYSDGDRDGVTGLPRITRIRFYCDPTTPLGQPKFIEQASEAEGEAYYFDFQTSLACSAKQVQCAIEANGMKYDLTPLALQTGNWDAVDVRPSKKHLHYYINVCKPYNQPVGGSSCPGGPIGGCQEDHKLNTGHNLGYVQSNPQVSGVEQDDNPYYGGDGCHDKFNRSTRINLHCSKTMGSPIFTTETPECEYVFDWKTPSACHLTRTAGPGDCSVTDEQYGYRFDLSSLYNKNKDYQIRLGSATLSLNVCNPTKSCGANQGACYTEQSAKSMSLGDFSKVLTYFDGEITLRYASSQCSVLIIFECDASKRGSENEKEAKRLLCLLYCLNISLLKITFGKQGNGPVFESKADKCNYTLRWATDLACRPMTHVQCSVRKELASGDEQYDFAPLAKSDTNWKAISSDSNVYYINMCRSLVHRNETFGCSPTAGVCKYDPSKKKYMNLGSLAKGPQLVNSNIFLLYEGGDACANGKVASTRILMECGGSEEAAPQFVSKDEQDSCRYEFLWNTKYACAINDVNQTVTNDCKATNPVTNYQFDINNLRDKKSDYNVTTLTGYYFLINVCGTLNSKNDCGDKSSSCQLLSSDPKFHFNAGNTNSQIRFADSVLTLSLTGGDLCHHSNTYRQTIISFTCKDTADDFVGAPVFVAESDQCEYYFAWETSYACERKTECSPVQYNTDTQTNTKYSLRQLAKDKSNWVVVPSGGTKSSYFINVCRPLVPMAGVNCPAGAAACEKTDKNAYSLGRPTGSPTIDENGKITILYKHGDGTRTSLITLTCAAGSLEIPMYDKCSLYDNSTEHMYNISTLKLYKGESYIELEAPDSSRVQVSVCGNLKKEEKSNCFGASVCLVSADGKETALGLEKFHSITYLHDENTLMLKYCNKDCATASVTSRLVFLCDREESNSVPYSLESVGKYGANVVWRTPLACPPSQTECLFYNNGQSYDLSLLSSRSGNWFYEDRKRNSYWFNICRGVSNVAMCPPSAAVCGKLDSSSRIVVLGYTQTQEFLSQGDNKIMLRYTGDKIDGCSRPVTVSFQFVCGAKVGKPERTGENVPLQNCRAKHPISMATIDFNKLHGENSYIKVPGNGITRYLFNLCQPIRNTEEKQCEGSDLCKITSSAIPMTAKDRKLFYEDDLFQLQITTTHSCPTGGFYKFIIDFECSDKTPVGTPVFEYESSSCQVVFSWATALVCTDLSGRVIDDASRASVLSSAGSKAGVAFAVIFVLLFIAAVVFVIHKRSRR
ncbi:predicted protein [Nematostella vectensis]|uniref:MRH domain-containing protein n=1 Tax=Nematostella vectensis TaxID=45351 RepID=A7RPB2_NEMVE|nr:predicted protein [Nematostella vectensis]|eukprot:XP_001638717.1 predicted protein [Nematostella vectensis]